MATLANTLGKLPTQEEREQFFRNGDEDCTFQRNKIEIETPKSKLHKEICEELNFTYITKNADYGDSYGQLRERFPKSILIRIFDKFSRLERLLDGNEQMVKDESIEDTLKDLANYCIMEMVERRSEI